MNEIAQPRTVYLYKKADMDSVKLDINKTLTNRLENIKPEYNVEDNWIFPYGEMRPL